MVFFSVLLKAIRAPMIIWTMKMELFEVRHYQTIAVVYCVILLPSFILNTSVIVIFFSNQSLLTSSNILLLSMAISDWLMAVLANTVGAYANASYWWTLDGAFCQYFGFVSSLCGLTSMVHLTALSVERWMTVKMAMTEEPSKRKMMLIIAGLWLFTFMWCLFPLIGWSSYGPEPGFAGCSITWYSTKPSDKAYIMCLFIVFFFLPIIVITFCYTSVYIEVRKMTKDAVGRWGQNALPTQQTMHAQRKTIRMSVVMVLAYLIAWTPYAVVSLYSSFIASDITPLLSVMPAFFAKLSSCYNPIIYFFMYSKFRKAAKKLFTRHVVAPDSTSGQGGSKSFVTSFPRAIHFMRFKKCVGTPLPGIAQESSVYDVVTEQEQPVNQKNECLNTR